MNTFKNNAEKTTARIKGVHAEKVAAIAQELNLQRAALPAMDKMRMNLDDSTLHKGKIVIAAKNINVRFGNRLRWEQGVHFQVRSGERLAVKGVNGSGKTTLIKLLLCSLTIGNRAPDIIAWDEPTNNLDIRNMEILTAAINEYNGTLIVVSHDEYFLEQVHITRVITMA